MWVKTAFVKIYNEKIFPYFRYSKVRLQYRFDVMSFEDTIEYILKKECSIARFGDGEFGIMMKSNHPDFQKYDEILAKRLEGVACSDNKKLLVCVPYSFISTNDYNEFAKKFWDWWLWDDEHLLKIAKRLKLNVWKKKIFGNAQITRPYMDWIDKQGAKKRFDLLKSLWEKKDIIIVEGKNTKLGVGNDLFDNTKSIKRIIGPSKNAFLFYDKILEVTKKNASGKLVLIALGPTATILAFDLCMNSIQALDIGHIDIEYEWFLKGANKKEAILGKAVQEIHGELGKMDFENGKYLSEIIECIEC